MCCILFVGYNNGDSVGDDTEVSEDGAGNQKENKGKRAQGGLARREQNRSTGSKENV